MADRRNRSRFTVRNADNMRAEVSATVSSLAQAANISREVCAELLAGNRKTRHSCEKVINGLRKLGHETASFDDIEEHSE